jgi:hypothetical protein
MSADDPQVPGCHQANVAAFPAKFAASPDPVNRKLSKAADLAIKPRNLGAMLDGARTRRFPSTGTGQEQ